MVKRSPQHSEETRAPQETERDKTEANKIGASTQFDFSGKNLTPYGGLLRVATMLEKLGFQELVEETLTVHRIPRVMAIYQFLLGMVLALYVGFSRLNHLRFVAHDAMLTGILKVLELPPQCTFWRFLASLHLGVARQLLQVLSKVAAGETSLDQKVVRRAVDKLLRARAGVTQAVRVLTNRELEIVRLVATGLRNKQIADQLSITEGTVKIHLHTIFEKLGVSSRVELSNYARERSLL